MRLLKLSSLFSLLFLVIDFINLQVAAFSVEKIKGGRATTTTTVTSNPIYVFTTIGLQQTDVATAAWEAPIHGDTVSTGKVTSNLIKKCDTCPKHLACVPQIQCPAHVRMKDYEKPQICDLPGGVYGYCCVTGQNHTVFRPGDEHTSFTAFLPVDLVAETRRKFEKLRHEMIALPVRRGDPGFLHSFSFHSMNDGKQSFHLSNSGMQQIIAGQLFSKQEDIPLDDLITNNVRVEFTKTPLAHHCHAPRKCLAPYSRYRTFDGNCNNRLASRSLWGAAGQPMERLMPPAYEDGIWTPRVHSVDGSELMGAREASRRLMADVNRPHAKHNLLLMQFGQFLSHDVLQSMSARLEHGELVECCTPSGAAALPAHKRHFACMPIPVEHDDEFFSVFNVRCMNFVRLSLAPNVECRIGYGKQLNQVTHFIDGSTLYGSKEESANALREFNGGRLRMFNDFGRQLLPMINDEKLCMSDISGNICYKSGDGRTNQIISLTALHTLGAREHNRVADVLAHMNPHFSDEMLFQEARRIVIAELQHITYNEYLSAVIGPSYMKKFRLTPQARGYANDYSPEVNPAVTSEFATAAFRMGHSTVDGKFRIQQHNNHVDEIINIPDVMFNPTRLRMRSFYDDVLRTMYTQPMQKVDNSITYGLSRFMFRGHNPFGLDLAAINIQRGRDVGLRCYNDYLEVIGQRKIRNFHELPEEIGKKLAEVYHHPDDIELWIGGLLENSVPDGIVGTTFAEIIADQFSRFKRGDRYFYEYDNEVNPGAFTVEQLREIRKVTMARLICDNADHVTPMAVPPIAFVRADFPLNQPVRCDSAQIPVVNLEAWRD